MGSRCLGLPRWVLGLEHGPQLEHGDWAAESEPVECLAVIYGRWLAIVCALAKGLWPQKSPTLLFLIVECPKLSRTPVHFSSTCLSPVYSLPIRIRAIHLSHFDRRSTRV
jgi:hypothetical protein